MGLTRVRAVVANPFEPEKRETLSFLVDSGAAYSVIPEQKLRKLGIEPSGERVFFLANGQPVRRRVGEARITFAATGRLGGRIALDGKEVELAGEVHNPAADSR